MKFSVEIGECEKSILEYHFNQLLGRLEIKINNEPIQQRWRLFNEPIREVYDLTVGQMERSTVRIERERGVLFGQKNRLYVNNRLVGVYNGV